MEDYTQPPKGKLFKITTQTSTQEQETSALEQGNHSQGQYQLAQPHHQPDAGENECQAQGSGGAVGGPQQHLAKGQDDGGDNKHEKRFLINPKPPYHQPLVHQGGGGGEYLRKNLRENQPVMRSQHQLVLDLVREPDGGGDVPPPTGSWWWGRSCCKQY